MPKRRCDLCEKPATHHSVEIIKGQKIEKHLCDEHAAEQGLAVAKLQAPINQLLSNFVKMHSGSAAGVQEMICDSCGMSFTEFREHSLLGCPRCYVSFEPSLAPLLERAQEGANSHIGKVPRRAGAAENRQQQLLHLRKKLAEAVESENYELAVRLRDEINRVEKGQG